MLAEGEFTAGDAEHEKDIGLCFGAGGADEYARIEVAVEGDELAGFAD